MLLRWLLELLLRGLLLCWIWLLCGGRLLILLFLAVLGRSLLLSQVQVAHVLHRLLHPATILHPAILHPTVLRKATS